MRRHIVEPTVHGRGVPAGPFHLIPYVPKGVGEASRLIGAKLTFNETLAVVEPGDYVLIWTSGRVGRESPLQHTQVSP